MNWKTPWRPVRTKRPHWGRGMTARMVLPILGAVAGMAYSPPTSADSLMVSATTVVLSDRVRAGSVSLGGGNSQVTSIAIDNVAFVQTPEGRLQSVAVQEGPHEAATFIRYGPRRVVTEARRALPVRLAARPPTNLPAGEYRMHLRARVLHQSDDSTPYDDLPEGADGHVSARIPIRLARAVRVLYRHHVVPQPGRLVSVDATRRDDAALELVLEVAREGETSLIAEYLPYVRMADGRELALGEWRGLNIYAELDGRRFSHMLDAHDVPNDARICVRLRHTDPGAPSATESEHCAG